MTGLRASSRGRYRGSCPAGSSIWRVKKLTQSAGERPKPAKLYLDDLEQLFEVFSSTGSSVRILTPEFEMTTLQELASLPDRVIKELKMQCSDPYVSLDLEASSAWLYRAGDDNASRGAVDRIRTIMARRRRRLAWFAGPIASGLLGGLALSLVLVGVILAIDRDLWSIAAFLVAAGIAWPSIRFFVGHPPAHTVIVLARRSEAPGFWTRNRDTLIVAFIVAVATAGITWLVANVGS